MAGCSIKATDGGQDCAHELGRLVAERFRDLVAEKDGDYALDVYVKAVRRMSGTVNPDTLAEQVAREIIAKEGLTLREPPSADERAENPEWVNVGFMTFASLHEALTYYLAFHEGTGTFCITLPVVGNVCLF